MIEQVFAEYAKAEPRTAPLTIKFIEDLISEIRPEKSCQSDVAVKAIQALCYLLHHDAQKRQLLREALLSLLSEHYPISLFLVSRHSVFSGFFTEMRRRVSHKILPSAVDHRYLIDLFSLFFKKPTDALWVTDVPDDVWDALITAIRFNEAPSTLILSCRKNLLAATQVLSYRIAALGLEPELLRNYPELELHTSPFITQHTELAAFLEVSEKNLDAMFIEASSTEADSQLNDADIKHIFVMLDQCNAIIAKIRRNTSQTGTSIHLTYLLQQMAQQIARLECLLNILNYLNQPSRLAFESQKDNAELVNSNEIVKLFKALVYSECHKNDLSEHWQENVEVMALRVTENASRTGEHYITESRAEYFALMRSAMGAGCIIAVMAMLKLCLAKQHLAPLTEAIAFSLNYALGFIIIHILHFTVATKQPAMTAAAIAASIDASDSKSKEMDNLVTIIANTMRSQLVAIFGNVVIAVPLAMAIGWAIFHFSGQHFIPAEKAQHLLADIDPLKSGALFYAGIAGVCLFLSGLIAGYHDNLAIYNKIPQRLRAIGWLQKVLGVARLDRVANYVENNLGALAGNFYFGCLLGGMSAIGILFGLPFDIRHIAFSSAFVGYSSVALDFSLAWQAYFYAVFCLMMIGFVNLAVSFSLALYVAMKSRKVRFKQWRLLIKNLASRLNQQPAQFIMPPKKALPASQD
jgi:site-specific recombinase